MVDSWNQSWRKFFVFQDTVEDKRHPGKMKCKHFCSYQNNVFPVEFDMTEGEFVCLAPKSYIAYDAKTKTDKKGLKGISDRFSIFLIHTT